MLAKALASGEDAAGQTLYPYILLVPYSWRGEMMKRKDEMKQEFNILLITCMRSSVKSELYPNNAVRILIFLLIIWVNATHSLQRAVPQQ